MSLSAQSMHKQSYPICFKYLEKRRRSESESSTSIIVRLKIIRLVKFVGDAKVISISV